MVALTKILLFIIMIGIGGSYSSNALALNTEECDYSLEYYEYGLRFNSQHIISQQDISASARVIKLRLSDGLTL